MEEKILFPLVSIIMPLYNAEKYVAEAIESVIAQTYTNWELIIVNDGSTDKSLDVAKKFESEIIKVFSQANKGASAARNYGLKEAKGEYLQFLDADDIISSGKIENQVHILINNPTKISVCTTVHFFDGDNYIDYKPNVYEDSFTNTTDTPAKFLIKLWGGYDNNGSMIQPNAWLTPREILERAGFWNENLSLDDDGEFFCRVLLNSDGIVKCPSEFNYYRKFKKGNNLSSTHTYKGLESLLNSAISKKKHLLNRTNTIEAKKAIQNMFFDVAFYSYPKYLDLVKKAEENFLFKNFQKKSMGGPIFNLLATIIGWKLTKRIQFLIR